MTAPQRPLTARGRLSGARGAGFVLAALLATALLAHGAAIHAKGWLGQQLMARSWQRAIEAERAPDPPWPGARTRPVARLVVPDLAIDRLVLDGIDLPNLAWGPGLARGAGGHHVLAGHRDTHFRFLGDLAPGHRLSLQTAAGPTTEWEVVGRRVVDGRDVRLDLDAPGPLLSLVTCYPLDGAAPGTPFRLIVRARALGSGPEPATEALAWAP